MMMSCRIPIQDIALQSTLIITLWETALYTTTTLHSHLIGTTVQSGKVRSESWPSSGTRCCLSRQLGDPPQQKQKPAVYSGLRKLNNFPHTHTHIHTQMHCQTHTKTYSDSAHTPTQSCIHTVVLCSENMSWPVTLEWQSPSNTTKTRIPRCRLFQHISTYCRYKWFSGSYRFLGYLCFT